MFAMARSTRAIAIANAVAIAPSSPSSPSSPIAQRNVF
jgi:hypothetical protein